MEDNLQRFVQEHRDAFDDQEPPAGLWNRIETGLQPKAVSKRPVFHMIIRAAAAAVVVFLAGTGVYYLLKKEKTVLPAGTDTAAKTDTVPTGVDTNNIAALAPDYAGQVYQFAGLIATKRKELKAVTSGKPDMDRQFQKDFYQLDSSYAVLKQQLPNSPDREALLQALIYNLELQLQVLNNQLNMIRDINNPKNNNHENVDSKTS